MNLEKRNVNDKDHWEGRFINITFWRKNAPMVGFDKAFQHLSLLWGQINFYKGRYALRKIAVGHCI